MVSQSLSEVYKRTLTQYEVAVFYKPRDGAVQGLQTDLAPLIVQQVIDEGAERRLGQRFGALVVDDHGNVSVDTRQPTVYTATGTVMIHGVEHVAVDYSWYYPTGADGQAYEAPVRQTVRLILDVEGFPLLCEVLGPVGVGSRADEPPVLFVSESLERRAAEAYGSPLPGRRYAIERSLENAPSTIVARTFEDGPIPMGPYLYLDAGTHHVSTVLCRCSASQVDRFLDEVFYELLPAESSWHVEGQSPIGVSPGQVDVEGVLRWPDE